MLPRERFLAALNRETPQEVPYYESQIDDCIADDIYGQKQRDQREISLLFHRDHVPIFHFAPNFADMRKTSSSGEREFFSHGRITCEADLEGLRLPSSHAKELYETISAEVKRRGDLAVNALIGLAVDEAVLAMGLENFCYALYDNRSLVGRLLDMYVDYYAALVDHLMEIGIDFLWAGTDIAYRTGPMFDPDTFRDLLLPRIRGITERITVPWIFHSDGNILPVMEDLLSLGMNAIHPIEPDAMDIEQFADAFGERVCLAGNVSIDLLSRGTPEQVEEEVKRLMRTLGPRGGYIISSANSIPAWVLPGNYRRMVETIARYRRLP